LRSNGSHGAEAFNRRARDYARRNEQGIIMLSFHSDPSIKSNYLARVAGHADADEIVKGRYWENGKGCAVGCTIHGEAHESFERELGIPRMLAWLEDVIFEGLPNRFAKTWPERFLSSIVPGRDLSPVGWEFLHWLLTESGLGEFDHALTKAAVARCADTLAPLIDRRPVDVSAAKHAATAARTAMDTVSRIDRLPDAVAWSAESAALAAESAALSGTDLTVSAERAVTATSVAIAGSKDYIRMSEKLLELLEAA
jgi:hypothetical protein